MKRKALLVGIDQYIPPAGPNLNGCVNDVTDMLITLNSVGIVPPRPGSMRILTNTRATKARILDGIRWLVKGAREGDALIFYYSGHGSRVVDVDGEEIDGYDETICPTDIATAGDLTDDEIREALSGVPEGVNLEVIFDSCHSGTATRGGIVRSDVPEKKSFAIRYMEPPIDWGFFMDVNPKVPRRGISRPKEVQVVTGLNHVHWGACRDYQTSSEVDIGGIRRGVFTYNLCQIIRRSNGNINRRKLDGLVNNNIKAYGQTSQLECIEESMDQIVFT